MNKTVSIIGGGMAGLCAGSYLQMHGYDVTIFEMNDTPGGVCTSWKRGDYTVDLCIHWLVGSGPASSFYDRWSELIDLHAIQFVDHDEFFRVEDGTGNDIRVLTNIDALEQEFLRKAPEDKKEINHFIDALRRLSSFQMSTDKAQELANVWERLRSYAKLLPYLGTFGKYMKLTCRQYSDRFQNPLLKRVMLNLPGPEMGILFGMITLTWFHNRTAGYPVGGSLAFAKRVYENYIRLGGKIAFHSRVSKILVDDHTAVGIELPNGEKHLSDYVISAADGHATVFEMLDGKYLDEKLRAWYENARPFSSLVFVSVGVNRDLSAEPHMLLLRLAEPLRLDPQTALDEILVHNHGYDATFAPAGHTLLTFMLPTYDYEYWNGLYMNDKERHEKEKSRITGEVIRILERRWRGIGSTVEMTDVATPATFGHFSGNWKGSFEGWQLTPEQGLTHLPHCLPGLRNFFMCGQWVAVGGGLPGVLLSGRDTAQLVCHADGIKFSPPQGGGL